MLTLATGRLVAVAVTLDRRMCTVVDHRLTLLATLPCTTRHRYDGVLLLLLLQRCYDCDGACCTVL
jgi:hypothetical protein